MWRSRRAQAGFIDRRRMGKEDNGYQESQGRKAAGAGRNRTGTEAKPINRDLTVRVITPPPTEGFFIHEAAASFISPSNSCNISTFFSAGKNEASKELRASSRRCSSLNSNRS